jgi:hypothetical protein
MSRLDSAIRRLQAQRACLDHAIGLIDGLPGSILELGLGNGRTYDHLRAKAGDREIFVFDRQVAAHPDCVPDDSHLFLGDFRETLAAAAARLGSAAILAHCDIGSGDKRQTAALAAAIGPALVALLAPNAVILSDQALSIQGSEHLPLPDGVTADRYYIYRRRG